MNNNLGTPIFDEYEKKQFGRVICKTNKKFKMAGNIIEIEKYGRFLSTGKRPKSRGSGRKNENSIIKDAIEIRKMLMHIGKHGNLDDYSGVITEVDNRKIALLRAKRRIIDYINANCYAYKNNTGKKFKPIFITFTFEKNITDLDYANKEFKNFTKRFNYEVLGRKDSYLKYVSVIEFQKRGAIHYHTIYFNLPFIKNLYDKLKGDLWPHGYSLVKPIDRSPNMGQYVCKYFTKEIQDPRLMKRKSYLCSKSLFKPIIINNEHFVRDILPLLQVSINEEDIYFCQYEHPFLVTVEKHKFNIKKYPNIKDQINEWIKPYVKT